jgi:DHA2 family multidrug resistance protein-like MFS transporter
MGTPKLARTFRASTVMAVGLVSAAVGFSLFIGTGVDSSLGTVVAGSVLFALGMGPVFTLTNDLIIGSAPPERAGAAAGISETAAELGGALGIALFGSIGIALYRGAMATGIPSGVPPGAVEASRDTLGGAVEVASGLPEEVGSALIGAARAAFLRGMRVSAVISAVGTLALAIGVVTLLRRLGVEAEPAAEDATRAVDAHDAAAV